MPRELTSVERSVRKEKKIPAQTLIASKCSFVVRMCAHSHACVRIDDNFLSCVCCWVCGRWSDGFLSVVSSSNKFRAYSVYKYLSSLGNILFVYFFQNQSGLPTRPFHCLHVNFYDTSPATAACFRKSSGERVLRPNYQHLL